jgi:thiol-disulfide isomerase/thioredoxin
MPTPGLPNGPPSPGDTVIPVPEVPRFPLRVLALSTVLALGAAVAIYVVLDDNPAATTTGDTVQLTPEEGATFTTFDGESVALSSLRGTPVLVNFFASTCVPCVTEMPALEEVHQQVGDQVSFLGLAAQGDRPEDALALVAQTGVTYRTARDTDASVMTALGGMVLPTTVLLDADGNTVAIHSGKLDADQLRALLADELGISP